MLYREYVFSFIYCCSFLMLILCFNTKVTMTSYAKTGTQVILLVCHVGLGGFCFVL